MNSRGRGERAGGEASEPVSPAPTGREEARAHSRNLLRPAILLLLRDRESHGYELMGRLSELGVDVPPTTGWLYRSLRTMADEGLLTWYWNTADRGPARRVYAVTEKGERHLEDSMAALVGLQRTGRGMVNRYRGKS